MSDAETTSTPILELHDVKKYFAIQRGLLRRTHGYVQAVDGVDLFVRRAESVGLVGESGSGKTTLGRLGLRLIEPTSGTIRFSDTDITSLKGEDMRRIRRNMQMVFQDPYASFDPRSPVSASVAEPLKSHLGMKGDELEQRLVELYELVGLSRRYMNRYPREFSGGQLQRLAVARAIATEPDLVVLDEPVSSLDVSTRAEIINLLADLQDELDVGYLFIAHDLAVVRAVCDRIAVMYLGRIVEEGDSETICTRARHPYTQALISAIPEPDPVKQRARRRIVLSGDLPSPANPPPGCRFHTRCPQVMDVCRTVDPPYVELDDGVTIACHLFPGSAGVARAFDTTGVARGGPEVNGNVAASSGSSSAGSAATDA
jgi:oligopeptide/dipeptide ABC transporter ATP-binding protein